MAEENENMTADSGILLADWYDKSAEGENYTFTEAGYLYRLMNGESKIDLINNIVDTMRNMGAPSNWNNIDLLQLCYWFRADMNLGMAIAYGLNLDMKEMMKHMSPG